MHFFCCFGWLGLGLGLAGCTLPSAPESVADAPLERSERSAATVPAVGPAPVVSWRDNSNNEREFVIERAVGAAGAWAELARAPENATAYRDTDALTPALYQYRLFAVNAGGPSATTAAVSITLPRPEVPGRLLNFSNRAWVEGGERVMIAGLVVADGTVHVLVRAIGPTLALHGIAAPLADPRLRVVEAGPAPVVIATNDNWNGPEIVAATAAVGAFPLPAGSRDAVLLLTLPAGTYTVIAEGAPGASGIALLESYQVPTP